MKNNMINAQNYLTSYDTLMSPKMHARSQVCPRRYKKYGFVCLRKILSTKRQAETHSTRES